MKRHLIWISLFLNACTTAQFNDGVDTLLTPEPTGINAETVDPDFVNTPIIDRGKPRSGNCYPSFPLNIYVIAKADTIHYLVSQSMPGLVSDMGAIEITSHQAFKGERLNTGIKYLGSKQIQGDDGFDHEVDLWRECQL